MFVWRKLQIHPLNYVFKGNIFPDIFIKVTIVLNVRELLLTVQIMNRKNEKIDILKIGLSGIAKQHGFHTVHDFYKAYHSAKNAYADYQDKVSEWEEAYRENAQKSKKESIRERLQNHQKEKVECQVRQIIKTRKKG